MNALVAKLIRYDWFIRMQPRYSGVVPELVCMPSEGYVGRLVLARQSAAQS
jgi:hypothetical protein